MRSVALCPLQPLKCHIMTSSLFLRQPLKCHMYMSLSVKKCGSLRIVGEPFGGICVGIDFVFEGNL